MDSETAVTSAPFTCTSTAQGLFWFSVMSPEILHPCLTLKLLLTYTTLILSTNTVPLSGHLLNLWFGLRTLWLLGGFLALLLYWIWLTYSSNGWIQCQPWVKLGQLTIRRLISLWSLLLIMLHTHSVPPKYKRSLWKAATVSPSSWFLKVK